MMESGYDTSNLAEEALSRWLKPAEVYFILQNCDEHQLTQQIPRRPESGSLFLFNKRVLKFFRKDGHIWRRRRDQRSVSEAHEKLKVGNVEALNCYYAHGEENPNFQRRSYWILDPEYEHLVLVHYRDTHQGVQSALPASNMLLYSSITSPTRNLALHSESSFVLGNFNESYDNELSSDPVEVSSYQGVWNHVQNVPRFRERREEVNSVMPGLSHALQMIEQQLSLNDEEVREFSKTSIDNKDSNNLDDSNDLDDMLREYALSAQTSNSSDNLLYQTHSASMALPHVYSPEVNVNGTISEKKFTIRELSPQWCYTSDLESMKIFIIGSFLCNPLEGESWACMFGDIEVPAQLIQDGVLCCHAPWHLHGKVPFCITSGNRVCCSEIREFEYRDMPSISSHNFSPENVADKNSEELLLLVRLTQILLSESVYEGDNHESSHKLSFKSRVEEDYWSQTIDAVLFGSSASSSTLGWLVEELLKDKLEMWLLSKMQNRTQNNGCSLSKKEQGMIHIVSGLGFERALQLILNSGVSVNFRDINGRTALHWAARFGREKMVASLIASGASAGAVTDPTSQDPTGKTPASIASIYGHKGLAGYLSEVMLTSHLKSLILEESDLSRGSAEAEAERTVNSITITSSSSANVDQVSLTSTLAAFRRAAQAAARIQSAFRAHSFRKRQQREAMIPYLTNKENDFRILENDVQGLSAAAKFAFRNAREYNSAALSIQKKYRGWKGRKDFLTIRQNIVKIQAHVRGHQVRKNYKVCWAVGILEKLVLRWRRRGVGLRGFRNELDYIDTSEDEDILKMFRKQKVDAEVDEAVSRVLSMVESPEARQQYQRILEKYSQAKAELRALEPETSSPKPDIFDAENTGNYRLG